MVGGDDGETGLFTGTDDATRSDGGTVIPGDEPPIDPAESFIFRRWLKRVTYDEIHAFVVGFGPMFIGLLLLPFTPRIGTVFLGLATLLTSAAIIEKHRPTKALRYILGEVHYYLGGQVLAVVLGVLWVGLVALLGHLAGMVA